MRKKGKWKQGNSKYILEKYNLGKIEETKTVPKPKILWELIKSYEKEKKASSSSVENEEQVRQKDAYATLSEPSIEDLLPELTEEKIKKLEEVNK